ncbi:MAG TPA: MraY family glycosyltransferase [Burkholderiaceae bacterium]|nr:MraY family glycosyltransferase [Burkholderiaceae bacterium]
MRGSMPLTYLAQAAEAAFIAGLLILMLRRPAERWGLVDHPGGRKRHAAPVPLTGGLAITIGTILALAFSFSAFTQYSAFFAGLLLLALVGLMDDLGEVSPGTKLLLQVMAALLMTSWGENFLVNLGDLFGTNAINTRHWAIPLTVLAALAVINAINMLDGLDGLAGSLVLGILLVLTAFAWNIGDPNAAKILVVLAGALAGFLFFNLPWPVRGRHRTFMGDAGSMVLGYAIAWFSVALSQHAIVAVPPPVMLWVLGLVLMDVFTVTVRRLARRRSPMAADRDHIHHMLLRRGFSPWQTLGLLVGTNLLMATIGTMMWRAGVADRWIFWSYLAVCAVYFALFFMPFRLYRLRARALAADEYERDR